MQSKPSLSVVITTRNSADTIRQCLDSLMPYLRDGHISEVIVVDGCSTDRTVEIVRSYPVRLLFEEGIESYANSVIRTRYGIYHASDIGWHNSSSDLVMFLDSDASLGDGCLPRAADFFNDEQMGILGCWPKARVTGGISRTIGQAWQFHGERIAALQDCSPLFFEKLYRYVAWFGNKQVLTSGPCYIARKTCLEAVGGHDILGDVGLCLHIMAVGWKSCWWIQAPVFHLPEESLSALAQQRYRWGLEGAFMPSGGWRHSLSLPLRIVGTGGLGLFLAGRFRNPRHLVTLPLAETAHLAGYLAGKIAKARGIK